MYVNCTQLCFFGVTHALLSFKLVFVFKLDKKYQVSNNSCFQTADFDIQYNGLFTRRQGHPLRRVTLPVGSSLSIVLRSFIYVSVTVTLSLESPYQDDPPRGTSYLFTQAM